MKAIPLEECFGKKNGCRKRCRFKLDCTDKLRERSEDFKRNHFRSSYNEVAAFHAETPVGEKPEETPEFYLFGNFSIPYELRLPLIELIQHMAVIYEDKPTVFDLLMKKTFSGMKQSDVARIRGVTRQAISKRLMKEFDVKQRHITPNKLLSLTPREISVYKLIHVEGRSYRQAGQELGISKDSICRAIRALRRKGLVCATDKDA